jgi:hypothetical protein
MVMKRNVAWVLAAIYVFSVWSCVKEKPGHILLKSIASGKTGSTECFLAGMRNNKMPQPGFPALRCPPPCFVQLLRPFVI